MSRQVLKTLTTQADRVGESCPPPPPRKGTVWEFQRTDFLPSSDGGHTVWHTYVLVEIAPQRPVVSAVIRYTPYPGLSPLPYMQELNGLAVAVLSVKDGRATCLSLGEGKILNVDFTSLEIDPAVDAADVRALYLTTLPHDFFTPNDL